MKRYLNALPPYLGGKRKLARAILQVAESEGFGAGATLADAFMGGGSVSMTAKALGYRVHANDVGPISVATGKALIENDRFRLTAADVVEGLEADPVDLPDERELSMPLASREVLARIAGAERKTEGIRRWLFRAWLARSALHMSSWGIPTRREPDLAVEEQDFDDLTPGQASRLLRMGKPIAMAASSADALNLAVFDNGHENTMSESDAIDFLSNVKADVAYLDPPYPGTLPYEQAYAGLNRLLDRDASRVGSDWSGKDGWQLIEQAIQVADDIPMLIVSMGTGADPLAITEMMKATGRDARWESPDHTHLKALANAKNEPDELLVIGVQR